MSVFMIQMYICIYIQIYTVFYESDGTGSNFLKICKFNCDECK